MTRVTESPAAPADEADDEAPDGDEGASDDGADGETMLPMPRTKTLTPAAMPASQDDATGGLRRGDGR